MSKRVGPAETGIKVEFGNGPEPKTAADLDAILAHVAANRPGIVKPGDKATRKLYDQVRQQTPIVHVPQRQERPRERKAQRRRTSPSRGDPSEPEPPLAAPRTGAA